MTAERATFVSVATVDVTAFVGAMTAALSCWHGPCERRHWLTALGTGALAGGLTAGALLSGGPEDPGLAAWSIAASPLLVASGIAIMSIADSSHESLAPDRGSPAASDAVVATWRASFADPEAAATFARALTSCAASAELVDRHRESAAAEGVAVRFDQLPDGETPPASAHCGQPYETASGQSAVWFFVHGNRAKR